MVGKVKRVRIKNTRLWFTDSNVDLSQLLDSIGKYTDKTMESTVGDYLIII